MDRRTALKQLTAAGVGITMLQACNFGEERVPIAFNNLNVSVPQEDRLKAIVDAIIPGGEEGGIPGALALEADKFVWVMADDCLSADDQDSFMNGISGFDAMVRETSGAEFDEMSPEDRATALAGLMSSEIVDVPKDGEGIDLFSPDDVKKFVGITKGWTMQGYMQSEHIMTEEMPYQLVPQFFHGCVEIDPSKKININA